MRSPQGLTHRGHHPSCCCYLTGLVTNPILFCWLCTIKDQYEKVRFQHMHYQGYHLCGYWTHPRTTTPSAAHLMVSLFLCNSGINAGESGAPLKGTVSAQKALQGSETVTRKLLGGTKEKSISPTRDQSWKVNQWFCTKRIQEKIELVAWPVWLALSCSLDFKDRVCVGHELTALDFGVQRVHFHPHGIWRETKVGIFTWYVTFTPLTQSLVTD